MSEREIVKVNQLKIGDEFMFIERDVHGNIVVPGGERFFTVLDQHRMGQSTIHLRYRSSTNSGITHQVMARSVEVMVAT